MVFKQTPDNLRSTDTFEGILGVCVGPIKGAVNGLKSITLDGTPIEDISGTLNFKDTVVISADGNPAKFPQIVTPQLGAGGSPINVGLSLTNTNAGGTPGPFITKSVTNTDAGFLDFRFIVNRLYSQTEAGIFNAAANLEVQLRPTTSPTWISPQLGVPSGAYSPKGQAYENDTVAYIPRSNYGLTGQWLAETNSGYLPITGKTTSPYVYELRVKVPNTGAYANVGWEVRVRLREKDAEEADPNFTYRNIAWESITPVFPATIGDHEDWRGVAWMQVVTKASDQLTGVPEVSLEAETKIVQVPPLSVYDPEARTYTGAIWDGAWGKSYTNDPAWVINDALSDPLSGVSLLAAGSRLNKWDALEASKWFSERVSDGKGGTHPRYSLNLIVDQPQKADELIQYMSGAVGGFAWDSGDGEWRMVVDKISNPVDIFTLDNVLGEFQYSHTDVDTRYNDIKMTFLNEEQDYRQDFVQVFDSPSIAILGRKPTTLVAVGCTNRQEALRRAMVRLRASINETRMVNFTTNRRGKLLQQFSNILVADADLGNLTNGRVVSVSADRLNITLRDPVRLEVGVSYKIRFSVPNPTYAPDSAVQPSSPDYISPTLTTTINITNTSVQRGDVTTLYLASALPTTVADLLTVALEATNMPTTPKLYRVVELKAGEGDAAEYVAITAIEVDTGKQAAADNVSAINTVISKPPLLVPPPTVPSSGKVLSLVEIPNNYTLFATWVRPAGGWAIGYQVKVRTNGGAWATVAENTKETTIEIKAAPTGTYDVEVRSLDRLGRFSAPLTDSLNVNGYDGTALTLALTRDSASLPCDSTGNVLSFANASGAVNVFYGTRNVTADCTFSKVEINCAGTVSTTGAYSVTALSASSGSLTIQATYKGVSITKAFSLNKALAGGAGANGVNASVMTLSANAQVMTFDGATGSASPASQTISFSARLQNLTGSVAFTATAFSVTGTALGAVTLSGTGDTRTMTNTQFSVLAGVSYVVVVATLGSFTDTVTIVKLSSGASASVLALSTSAQTVTFDGTSGNPSPASQSISISANLQNLSGTVVFDAKAYNTAATLLGTIPLTGTGATRTLSNAQFVTFSSVAYVVITASLGGLSDSVSIVKLASGQNAVVGYLTSESTTFAATSGGVVASFSSAAGTFKVFEGLTDRTTSSAFSRFSQTGCTVAINATTGAYSVSAMSTDTASAVFRATYNGVTIERTLSLAKSKSGADAIVGYLTNEAASLAADSSGGVASFSSAAGTFKVFEGLTDRTTSSAFTVFSSAGCTVVINATTGAYSVSTMTTDTASAVFRAVYSGVTIERTLSLSKSRAGSAGADGVSASVLTLTPTAQTMSFNGDTGAASPSTQSITLRANLQNLTGTVTYVATAYSASNANLGAVTLGGTGNARTLSNAQFLTYATTAYVIVTATLGAFNDTATIVRLTSGATGANAVVGYLTSESTTFAADVGGVVASFSSAAGTFKVFEGLTDRTTSSAFSRFSQTGCTVAINATTGAYSVSAMSTDTASAVFRATYNGVTIEKTLSLSKSRAGSAGAAAITGYLTSESVAVFAYANGIVTSYAGATGSFKAFSGGTDISNAFTLTTLANPQALTVGYSGQTYSVEAGFDASEDTAALTIRATGTGIYASVIFDKVFSLSKTKGGYEIVTSLPTTNLFLGRVIYFSTDEKLYTYGTTGWTTRVDPADFSRSLTNDEIGDLSATKLTGVLAQERIAANSIVASKLTLIDTNNLLADPTFQDTGPTNYWVLGTGWSAVQGTTDNTTLVAKNVLRGPSGNGTNLQSSSNCFVDQSRISVEPGKTYRVYAPAIVQAGFTGFAFIRIRWYKSDGTTASATASSAVTALAGGNYTSLTSPAVSTVLSFEKIVDAPIDAAYAQFELCVNWSASKSNSGYVAYGPPRFMRAMNSELLVDGAIKSTHLDTGSVKADAIFAGAITAAAISTNTAVITGSVQIGEGVIKTANIGNLEVKFAHIGNLEVDTIKIKDNAVTRFHRSYDATGVASTSGSFRVVQTVSLISSNTALMIQGSFNLPQSQLSNANQISQIRITRNGTVIYLADIPRHLETFGSSQLAYNAGIFSFIISDQLGATEAAYGFNLEVKVFDSVTFQNVFLGITELKK